MSDTPEDMARWTGWSVADWKESERILGEWWLPLRRQVAELAGVTGVTPDQVAHVLVGDATRPGLVHPEHGP